MTIVPSGAQLAPVASAIAAIRTRVPSASATFCSWPFAKKPSQRPSGEKNGSSAPSVFAIRDGAGWSSLLT